MKQKQVIILLCICIIAITLTVITFLNTNVTKPSNDILTQDTEQKEVSIPPLSFTTRYLFTNSVEHVSLNHLINELVTHPDLSAKLIRFAKLEDLKELDSASLSILTDAIPLPCDSLELSTLGTTNFPTEEGIYRTVVEITDTHGNTTLEEIILIYDTTGAYIEDTPDKIIYADAANLNEPPIVCKTDYIIIDNVDGAIPEDAIQCELELRDEEKHEWLVHVSYTDRAGNNTNSTFLITIKENQSEPVTSQEEPRPEEDQVPSLMTETNSYHPAEQAVIDAGYGVVIQIDEDTYSVLTHGDGCVNGKDGGDFLIEYLAAQNLQAGSVHGCWIDASRDMYRWIAQNISELVTSEDEEFWD